MHGAFRADRLDRIVEIEDEHFWFVARRELVRQLVAEAVPSGSVAFVDVGCGSGMTLQTVVPGGGKGVGIDVHRTGLRFATEDRLWFAQGNVTALPLRARSADVVLALDVLEHVDDLAALDEIGRVLRPAGSLIVTVPAFPWLWSYRDEDAGHRRRYTARGIQSVLAAAGFEVVWSSYYQFFLFPLAVLSRLLGRRSRAGRDREDNPPRLLNRMLRFVNRAEVALVRRGIRFPWGTSFALVARLRDEG